MKPHKALGPDGLHAFLLHRYWEIIANDIVSFSNDFLRGNLQDPYSNDVVVVLIPKIQNATTLE